MTRTRDLINLLMSIILSSRYDARGSPYNATFWTDLSASGFGYRARFEPDAQPGRIMMTMN